MAPPFKLVFAPPAAETLKELASQPQHAAKLKKVRKALGWLQLNPRHPGLQSHKYQSMQGSKGEDVWDSYVENNTPSAWRIFWHYGPDDETITVLVIGPHP